MEFSSIVTSNIKKKNSVDTMQSQKIQSVSFGKICSISDDRFSDYFKHTNEKSIHIIEVYFYLFFFCYTVSQ